MNKTLTEVLGTFVLAFVVVTTAVALQTGESAAAAPFVIGLALAIMIYAGGHISGAHYNPAVSVAATLRGALPAKDFLPYVIAQVLGAVGGALLAVSLKGSPAIATFTPELAAALPAELIITTMLAFVVLQTATVKAVEGNSYYGLSIGGTVTTGALSVGSISGGVFNPAIAVALCTIGKLDSTTCLAYIGVQLAAAALATVLFNLTKKKTDSSVNKTNSTSGSELEKKRVNA